MSINKLALLKPKTTDIPVKEGQVTVTVRALPAKFVLDLKGRELSDSDFYEIIALSVLDDDGQQMMTAEEAARLDFVTMNELAIGIMDFNNLSMEAVKRAKESLKKVQTEGSATN